MRQWCFLFLLLLTGWSYLAAQATSNPFELTPRLATVAVTGPVTDSTLATPADTTSGLVPESAANPFDIVRTAPARTASPAAAPPPPLLRPPSFFPTMVEEAGNDRGALFGLIVFSLLLTSVLLVFMRDLFQKSFRAAFNDNLLSQLYREWEVGMYGRYIVGYILFFLVAGLFLFLLGRHYAWPLPGSPLVRYAYLTLGVVGVMMLRHLLLGIVSYIFPLGREISRYNFTIIIFAAILGLCLAPANLLIAYGPQSLVPYFIYGTLGVIALLYLLRSLRGLFIANKLLLTHTFHFLLYICLVEFIPVLLLYKVITTLV